MLKFLNKRRKGKRKSKEEEKTMLKGSGKTGCSIEGCDHKSGYYAKGYCRNHYNKIRLYPRKHPQVYCKAPDCKREIRSLRRKYCSVHYWRCEKGLPLKSDGVRGGKGERNGLWKGGIFPYKNHSLLKRNRLVKIAQVKNHCEDCGKKKPSSILRAYHLDKSKSNHALENLKIICFSCMGKYISASKIGRKYKVKKEK